MTTQALDTQMPELPQAARLHLARYLAGMDVQELARATGISRNTITKYESLDADIRRNPAYLRVWALATGASYEWIAGGVTPGNGAPASDGGVTNEAQGLGVVIPFWAA